MKRWTVKRLSDRQSESYSSRDKRQDTTHIEREREKEI